MKDLASANSSSAAKALENLDINLAEINQLNQADGNNGVPPSELLISEIHADKQSSAASKQNNEERKEMEKMFTSGAFPKDLSGTFKEVRAEVQQEEAKLKQD